MNSKVSVVNLSGILSIVNVEQLRCKVAKYFDLKPDIVLLDMHNIHFVDSAAAGAIAGLAVKVKSWGGELAICSLKQQPSNILDYAYMHRYVSIFDSRDEFFASIRELVA